MKKDYESPNACVLVINYVQLSEGSFEIEKTNEEVDYDMEAL